MVKLNKPQKTSMKICQFPFPLRFRIFLNKKLITKLIWKDWNAHMDNKNEKGLSVRDCAMKL